VYKVIGHIAEGFSLMDVCRVLGISRSAYYAYLQGKTHRHRGSKAALAGRIEAIFGEHRQRYGSRRIRAELRALGFAVGRFQIRKRLREKGLKAIQPRAFVPKTTQPNPNLQRSENLLLKGEKPGGINQVWVGDITYIPLQGGRWLYLAVWMDLYSRRIVGWSLDWTLEAILVHRSLEKAFAWRRPPPGLIIHSDGGGQYLARDFRTLIRRHACRQSMTRVDNHYDNAFIESLFSRFKAELLRGKAFDDYEHAHAEIFEYIEAYYNRKRRHSSLDYKSPEAFENHVNELMKTEILSYFTVRGK
jgi:putative transposase